MSPTTLICTPARLDVKVIWPWLSRLKAPYSPTPEEGSLRAFTRSVTVPPAGTVTAASLRVAPLASVRRRVTTPPALNPLGSEPVRPVAGFGKPVEVIRSFSPKNWLKPWPALFDGVVGSSAMATPLPPAPCRVSTPLLKLAEPLAPSAVLRSLRKLPDEVDVGAPPSTLMVPASKSMSTRVCITPAGLTMDTVVLPVKPDTAVGRSSPVLRPVRVVGGGTAE